MRLPALARRLHKWLALLVGVQAVLWTISGLYMTAIPIEIIHGDYLVRTSESPPLAVKDLVEPAEVLKTHPTTRGFRLEQQLAQPVYVLETAAGSMLLDARTGEILSPLSEQAARARALALYAGHEPIADVKLMSTPPPEIRGRPGPVWRVAFDGWLEPTLYISPHTGRLIAKRHDLWRVFDVMWMLHIMDYQDRESTSGNLLRVATWVMTGAALTGAWLLIYSFRRRRRSRQEGR